MYNTIMILGSVVNLGCAAFHVALGRSIHVAEALSVNSRALMHGLNVAVILASMFFAYVSVVHRRQLVATPLGKAVLAFISAFYAVRAVEEPLLFDGSIAVLVGCALVSAAYAAPLFFPAARREAHT